jgi:hypothetical protein
MPAAARPRSSRQRTDYAAIGPPRPLFGGRMRNSVRKPWQPGHFNGFLPTISQSRPRARMSRSRVTSKLAADQAVTEHAVAAIGELADRVEGNLRWICSRRSRALHGGPVNARAARSRRIAHRQRLDAAAHATFVKLDPHQREDAQRKWDAFPVAALFPPVPR